MLMALPAPAALSPWLEGAVIIRLGPGPGETRFPALPHAMLTLRLARLPGQAGLVLCPPVTFHTLSTQPAVHAHACPLTAMGLLVRPEAAACLLGASTGALVDQVLPWALVAGASEAARLVDAVEQAGGDQGRLHALVASFQRTMVAVARGRDRDHALLCAVVGREGVGAAPLLGLGRRQLERRCQAVLGLAPKHFQRLVRFRRALTLALPGSPLAAPAAAGPLPLADVALEAGFYDQSHLARDARQLAGLPMRDLAAAARPDSPWWPLAARAGLVAR